MLVYIISAIILVLVLINWFLGEKLYEVPKDTGFFDNVNAYNLSKERYIFADPSYVVSISMITGALIGLYLAYAAVQSVNSIIVAITIIVLSACYLIELTRNITLCDGVLTLSKFFSFKKEIDVRTIKGMYIYSYNKKFLKKHAYTTKLVITLNDDRKIKFSLSSLDNKSVLNMMKDTFGITRNKMFISKRDDGPIKK